MASAAGTTRAQGPALSLTWTAPEGCPGQEAVRQRVVALAGPGVKLDATAAMTAEGPQYRVVLRVRNGDSVGGRVLQGSSCEALAESAAVVLAMSGTSPAGTPTATATAPEASLSPTSPLPPPPPPAPPPPSPATPPVVAPSPPPPPVAAAVPRDRRPLVRIAPIGTFDVGTLPTAVAGGGASVAVTPGRRLLFGLEGAAWLSDQGTLSGANSTQGASFHLLTLDARGCWGAALGPWRLSPCLLAELAHVSADGFRAQSPSNGSATWPGVGAGLDVRLELGRLVGLAFDVSGMVPLPQQWFVITHGGTVHETAPVTLRLGLGPELRF